MRAPAAVVVVVAATAATFLGFPQGLGGAAAQTVDDGAEDLPEEVWLEPQDLLKVVEHTSHSVHWFTILPNVSSVRAFVDDEFEVAVDAVGPVVRGSPGDNFTFSGEINVTMRFTGLDTLHVALEDSRGAVAGEAEMPISILLAYQQINDIFVHLLTFFVGCMYVIMGATLDLEIIKAIAKKPLGPLVGIVCQYIFMPLIAFGLGKAIFPGNILAQLGLFLSGSCPGGGASNMWTHLLGGSLDLSMAMTFTSTLTAFAAMPLWVLLLGPTIVQDADFVIPYSNIALLVLGISLPCFLGILVAQFFPRVGKVMTRLITPVTLFMLVMILVFGVYANFFVFYMLDEKALLAGFGLPLLGYLSGMSLATLLRLPTKDRIAISIETGIQNMSVAMIVLKLTLGSPVGDLTQMFPVATFLMTPIPLITAFIIRRVYLWRKGPQEDEGKETTKKMEMNGNVGAGGAKAVASGGKVDGGVGKVEGQEAREGRNGSAAPAMSGVDNPAMELEETM